MTTGMRTREQQLVDICFQLVAVGTDPAYGFQLLSLDDRMAWVAHQLRECGFPTTPMGMSWGVLNKEQK